jgi:hypothetical protein
MSKEFLSRENTSNIYKEVLKKNNLQALPKKTKEIIVNLLITNMKNIYKQIDPRKVTRSNVDMVMKQFNDMCLKETTKNLSNSDVFSGEDSQVSRVKFVRDFNSTPKKEVKFLERPSNGKSAYRRSRNRSDNSSESSVSSFKVDNQIRKSSNSLDNMFQPIGTQNLNNSDFGYMNSRDESGDVNKQMEQISQLRQRETDLARQRPPTPDFLKAQQTQEKKPDYENITSQPTSQPSQSNPSQSNTNEIEAMNSISKQEGNELGSYSGGDDNYFSLDQMDKPLVTNEITEDNSTFEERLKKLQAARDGVSISNQSNDRPEISSNGQQMQQNNNDQMRQQAFEQQMQQNNNQMRQQSFDQQKKRSNEELPLQGINSSNGGFTAEEERRQQLIEQQQREEQRQQQLIEQQQREEQRQQQLIEQKRREEQRQQQLNEEEERRRQYYMEQKRREEYEDQRRKEEEGNNDQMQMLLNRLNKLENSRSNSNDNELVMKLKEENKRLSDEKSKVENLKQRISDEFKELSKKNDLFKSNLAILNQRELELNNRETEINQLVNNYKQILGSRFYQMNVNSKDKTSKYNYYFNKLDDVISIKIVSYSMPVPRYNIDKNNNILKYSVNEESKEVIIPKGKYTITQLLEYLNRNSELNFNLNINQKVSVESSDSFVLQECNLVNSTLGISKEDVIEKLEDKFLVNASNTWDLRLHDKLFLYLTNINNDPVSIIYLNGHGESQIQFEEPIGLSQLDIELRDINGNLYDFNNLNHSINLQLELVNQFNEINVENAPNLEL